MKAMSGAAPSHAPLSVPPLEGKQVSVLALLQFQ